jgi:hypothetical protein
LEKQIHLLERTRFFDQIGELIMLTMKLFQLQIWDGGVHHLPKSIFFKKKPTKEELKFDCVYEQNVKIFEDFQEYLNWNDDSIREKALAKLSKEEKAALGLL